MENDARDSIWPWEAFHFYSNLGDSEKGIW